MNTLMNFSMAGDDGGLFWRHYCRGANDRAARMVSEIKIEIRRLEIVIGDGS